MMTKLLINGDTPIEVDLTKFELKKGDRLVKIKGKWYVEKMYYDRYKLKANGELEFIGKFRSLE